MYEKLYLDKRVAKADGTYPIKLYVRHKGKFLMSTNLFTTIEAWGENGILNKNDKHYKTKKNTAVTYMNAKNKVAAFDPDCTFDSIDKHWLERFDGWLSERVTINSKFFMLSKLKAVFNQAIDDGETTNYPFRKFRIKKEETRKRCLTVEQLRLLRDADAVGIHARYRDIFMLSFYLLGINIGDLCLLKKTDLHNGRIEYYRQKTHKLVSVNVEPEAMSIIEKYNGKGEWLLNIMDGISDYSIFSKCANRFLKRIKVDDDGTTYPDISTYWARHTWATIAAGMDIPKETIPKLWRIVTLASDGQRIDVSALRQNRGGNTKHPSSVIDILYYHKATLPFAPKSSVAERIPKA